MLNRGHVQIIIIRFTNLKLLSPQDKIQTPTKTYLNV